ncbi:ATP-dependent Clp protease proteolytic subunit [Methylobacterium pseudosasicola]|uniref:ATP-dependent protease ClpP, protease subunit n=1 Tax=Methylobacterium pseudosasicola TaxID=582667 RepID=A0A1I4HLJ9_9HYPH|nr:ATP-dependent Clp protease proteolytic subunit [Methylobacterium pseudosasicola]SFL42381.1 ATP-dependent protease ClpP, protease subunit [Methylobacterium pseudosasicola]
MRRYSLDRNDGRIWIDGHIAEGHVSAAAVRRSLLEVDQVGPVRVVIDTPGGSCAEGLAIYTAFRECGRPIEVTIRNAYSMGAVIAMAGERISIETKGIIGLHSSRVTREAAGAEVADRHLTAEALRRFARALWSDEATKGAAARVLDLAHGAENADATHLDILARRTGLARHDLTALRAAETELAAERAVTLGFADRIIPTLET